jgi:SAM-dependent methyltransferase
MLQAQETVPVTLESHPVKRPFSEKTIRAHVEKTLGELKFAKVLDVGFGELKRSTLALSQALPNATIHAIDNDISLLNTLAKGSGAGAPTNVVYSFGDAELWLPYEKYDLIVVCLTAHAFHNPFRAVCNLVQNNLNPNGYLLFVHRADAVMRAIVRLPMQLAGGHPPKEVEAISNAWVKIDSALESRGQSPHQLPWQAQFLCDHGELAACCEHLCLSPITDNSIADDYERESHDETLAVAFGTKDKEPQYQSPRSAWRRFRQSGLLPEWPINERTKLETAIKLQSVLYQKDSARKPRHAFFPIHATIPPQFVPLTVEAFAELKSPPVRESVRGKLPASLKPETHEFFYVADGDPIPFYNRIDAGEGVAQGESKSLLTDVLRRSESIWERRGTHDVLLLVFPALINPPQLPFDKAGGAMNVLGLRDGDLHIIPMLQDSNRLQTLLVPCGFNSDDLPGLAAYLSGRGDAARKKGCAAIYYLIYRSRVLNNNRDYQAICFWTTRWLGIEAIMALLEFGYSFLIAMEEKRAIELSIESPNQKKASDETRTQLETRIRALEAQIRDGQTLVGLPGVIDGIVVKQNDEDGLKNAYDRLNEAFAKLLQRIAGAALLKWGKDKTKVVEFLSQSVADRIQKKTKARAGNKEDNASILRGSFFNYIAGDKKRSSVTNAIAKLINAFNTGASSPEINYWIENVVKLKTDEDSDQQNDRPKRPASPKTTKRVARKKGTRKNVSK